MWGSFAGLVLVLVTGPAEAARKTWTANTNFGNPNNWNPRRMPCSSDTIVFPKWKPVVVYMPSSASIKEMVLPLNGQLIFPTNASIRLTEGIPDSSCPGEVLNFVASEPQDWFDPFNWNISEAHAAVRVTSDLPLLAVPHSERVPCRTDDVVFPSATSFMVNARIYGKAVPTARTLTVDGQRLDSDALREFEKTRTGRLLFPGSSDILLSGVTCQDPTGCACGNDDPQVLTRICTHQVKRCTSFKCSDPVKPDGHCCLVCATQILVDYETEFQFHLLRQLFVASLSRDAFIEIQGYMSKTIEGMIQMVLVDSGDRKGAASQAGAIVHDTLKQDIRDHGVYKVKTVHMKSSVQWYSGVPTFSPLTSSSEGLGAGSVVAIVIGITLLVGTALAVIFWYRRVRNRGFTFARFDTGSGKVELELGTTPHEVLDPSEPDPPQSPPKATGFANPIYGSPGMGGTLYGQEERETVRQVGENLLYGKIIEEEEKDSNM